MVAAATPPATVAGRAMVGAAAKATLVVAGCLAQSCTTSGQAQGVETTVVSPRLVSCCHNAREWHTTALYSFVKLCTFVTYSFVAYKSQAERLSKLPSQALWLVGRYSNSKGWHAMACGPHKRATRGRLTWQVWW